MMEQNENIFWVLGISQMKDEQLLQVKVLFCKDVLADGEQLWILGLFEEEWRAKYVRGLFGDEALIRNFCDKLMIDYSEIYPGR